jgi:hypothetical protein
MIENISATELIQRIVRWRKTFLWITVVSIIVGGIIVFLIPKQYKSTAIIFPARQFSVSKLVIEPNAGNQEDYMHIGDADDCEKLLQVLTSDKLRLRVADELNLWKRWRIKDTTFAYHYLKLKWEDMVAIKRTEFNSIKVEAYDYTANGAAQVANAIVEYCDSVKADMNREVAGQVLKIVESEYLATIDRMKVLEDSLDELRKIGVLHYKEQVKAYSKAHARAMEKNDVIALKRIEEKLDTLKKYGSAYQNTKDNLDKYSSKYPDIKMKYDEALVNYNSLLPLKFVVDKARPNEYKARPARTIILLIIVVACNLVGLFWLLIRERMKNNLQS